MSSAWGMRGSVLSLSFLLLSSFLLSSCQRPMGTEGQPMGGQCVAMQPGQSQPMQTQFGMLTASYSLAQEISPAGQVVYTATVPMQFVPEAGVRDRMATLNQIRGFANQCLAMAAPKMLGPKGEMLRIILNETSGGKQILVTDRQLPYGQGHSQRWTTHNSWQCPQVVHEVMHLVGLVDGYLDGSNTYDCRANGPADALTVAPDAAYVRAGLMMSPMAAPFSGAEPAGAPLAAAATGPSLLYPGEFNAIISPHCDVSQKYAICSANAYRNSRKHGCQQIPEDCYSNPQGWYANPGRL